MECFILAGGLSRRFGEDKLSYPLKGKKVLERVIDSARSVFEKVYIVAKQPEKFFWAEAEVIRDSLPLQAPIAGLLTALEKAEGERFCLLAGDYPLIRKEVLERLKESQEADAVVFCIKGQVHPLIGIYSKAIKDVARKRINSGDLSLMGLLKNVNTLFIEENEVVDADPELISFINLNTKEDLKLLMEKTG